MMVNYLSPIEFLRQEITNLTIRGTEGMKDDIKEFFVNDLRMQLREITNRERFSFPYRTNLVLGYWA